MGALATICDTATTVQAIDEAPKIEVKAYPNPAINQVTIEWLETEENNSSIRILIYNSLGQVVHQQRTTTNKVVLNTTNWTAGLYFYKLYQNNQEISTDKFTIIK